MNESPASPSQSVSPTTQWRDGKRSAEELEILQLARELDSLIRQYPRFKSRLYQTQAYVRNQLQPLAKKEAAIVHCLENTGYPLLDRDELVGDTNFDEPSVLAALASLVAAGRVDEVNREGNPPRRTKAGRATDRVYYRLRRPAVPSPTIARRG